MTKIQWTAAHRSPSGTGWIIPQAPAVSSWLARKAEWWRKELTYRANCAISQLHIMKNEFVTNLSTKHTDQVVLFGHNRDKSKYEIKGIKASIVWTISWKAGKSGINGYTVRVKSASVFIDLQGTPGSGITLPKTEAINLFKEGFDIQADITFSHTESSHKLHPTFLFVDFGNKIASIR
jgi:hypothetical protein